LKFFYLRPRRLPVPRTNILANIAAEHVVTAGFAKLLRNRPAQFNRQVSDTPPRVHHIRIDQRIRRARIDAPRTRPAKIAWQQLLILNSWNKFKIREDRPQKKP